MTEAEERRIRDIVRDRHAKSYTFAFAAWIAKDEMDKTADFFIISNSRTKFSVWRSLHSFRKSIKSASICIYKAPEGATDAKIYADVCEAIEARTI